MTGAIKDYASLLLDEKGHVKNWNKTAQKIKGYTTEEIVGKHFSVFYTPEDQKKQIPQKVLKEARRKGFTVYEGWRVRKDQSNFWGEIVVTALYDEEEQFTGFRELTRDLTHKHHDTTLENHNLDALINNTQDQMWSVDMDYRLISYNNAFETAITSITGKSVKRGANALALGFDEENTARYKQYYDLAFTGTVFKEEAYTDVPAESWSEITFYPLRNGSEIIGAACYTNDITERKKTQQILEQSEHRFRSLIEHSTDSIVILSAEVKSLYVSPSLKTVLGYTDAEGMEMSLFQLVHPDDVPELANIFKNILAHPSLPITYTCQVKHKSGKWRWMEGTMTNMLHDPAVNGIVNNFRDVTERKLAEEKRIRANQLYAFISGVNQTIVHVRDEETLFKRVCNIALQFGKFKAAWIGKIDQEHKTITLADHSGLEDDVASVMNDMPYRESGPTDLVLQTGSYHLCNNTETETNLPEWSTLMPKSEYRSYIIFPIKTGNKIIGSFNLTADRPDYFDPAAILLLREVAGDISFALEVFEKDRANEIAERKLAHSEFRLNQAQAIAQMGSWELNFSTDDVLWSEEACHIYGLAPEDNKKSLKLWLSFVHPEDLEMVMNTLREAEAIHNNKSFYHRIVRRDGTTRYIHTRAQFEFNSDGTPTGIYGVVLDITEQRENIMQLKEQNKQLGEIAWIQSHKVRGPLSTILGLAYLFKEEHPELNPSETLEGIISSSEQLDQVIREIVKNTVAANIIDTKL